MPSSLTFNVGRSSVDVRFYEPIELQVVILYAGDDLLGVSVANAASGIIKIEHRIDDSAALRVGVADYVADGVGG